MSQTWKEWQNFLGSVAGLRSRLPNLLSAALGEMRVSHQLLLFQLGYNSPGRTLWPERHRQLPCRAVAHLGPQEPRTPAGAAAGTRLRLSCPGRGCWTGSAAATRPGRCLLLSSAHTERLLTPPNNLTFITNLSLILLLSAVRQIPQEWHRHINTRGLSSAAMPGSSPLRFYSRP